MSDFFLVIKTGVFGWLELVGGGGTYVASAITWRSISVVVASCAEDGLFLFLLLFLI